MLGSRKCCPGQLRFESFAICLYCQKATNAKKRESKSLKNALLSHLFIKVNRLMLHGWEVNLCEPLLSSVVCRVSSVATITAQH